LADILSPSFDINFAVVVSTFGERAHLFGARRVDGGIKNGFGDIPEAEFI